MRQPTLACRRNGDMRLAMLVCAVLPALFLAAAALAHRRSDILIKSEPADGAVVQQSPVRVVVWFSTELDTGPSRLQVFAADKRQMDNGGGGVDLHDPDHASLLVRLPALPDGEYTVRWRAAVFADGDIVEGRFSFTVSGQR